MRHMMILIALGAATAGQAQPIDPDDPDGFCARMAGVYDWADTSDAVANCPCTFAGLKDQMTPEIFAITVQWQTNPSTLSGNLPDGMSVENFYDTVRPIFGAVEADCGPMR